MLGSEFVMHDGNKVVMQVGYANSKEMEEGIDLLLHQMHEHGYLVVGFDMEYYFPWDIGRYDCPAEITLLTVCTRSHCILIRLHWGGDILPSRKFMFLANKDIVFVGVNKKEDMTKLQNKFNLEINNAGELSELAVRVLGQPWLSVCGPRKLATYLEVLQVEPRCFALCWANWKADPLTLEQIECAILDAYRSYKIGKELLKVFG